MRPPNRSMRTISRIVCLTAPTSTSTPTSTITPGTPTSTSTLDNDTVSESQLDRIPETQSGFPLETQLNMNSDILPHTAEDLIQLQAR